MKGGAVKWHPTEMLKVCLCVASPSCGPSGEGLLLLSPPAPLLQAGEEPAEDLAGRQTGSLRKLAWLPPACHGAALAAVEVREPHPPTTPPPPQG